MAGQQTINLNFSVPIANDLQLGVSPGALTNLGLYRNNSGATYPYDIASAINITSSSANTGPYDYYYFYYNIEVETPCLNATQATYDCDGQGNCSDPGNGSGAYSSLNTCQTNCVISVTYDCDGQGICSNPGNGLGQYTSLSSCQISCFLPSWNCIEDACLDPGTGVGMYSSLTACNQTCGVSTIEEHTTAKTLLKITDILGRQTNQTSNKFLFYIYDDGTVNKRLILQ